MKIELIPAYVTNLIAEQMGLEFTAVTPEKRLVEDLGSDSLDTVELAMALEHEFNIEIPDDMAEKMITVQDAIDAVLRLQAVELSSTDAKTTPVR